MILPGPLTIRLQILLVLGTAVAAPLSFREPGRIFVIAGAIQVALLFLFLLDGWLLPGPHQFRARREVPRSLAEGRPFTVTLQLEAMKPKAWLNRRRLRYQIFDGLLPHLVSDTLPVHMRCRLPVSFDYACRAERRAVFVLEELFVSVQSDFRLGQRRFRLPVRTELVVQPLVPRVDEEFVAARRRLLAQQGQQRRLAPGGEREFYRLRDYLPGDEPRHIDWKASARLSHPVTREYEREQKQTLFLVVDCSRWMDVRSGGRSLLDEALSSALMLAGVAATRGDAVGFLAWGSGPLLFLPPAMRETAFLAGAVSRLIPENRNLDLNGLAAFLAGALRTESIVTLFTSVPHEEGMEEWVHFAGKVSASHRPLLILLESNETLAPLASSSIAGLSRLARRGNLFPLPVVEEADADAAPPEELLPVAVYHYLKEKERRLRLVAGRRFGVVYSTRSGLHPSVLGEYLRIRFAPTF